MAALKVVGRAVADRRGEYPRPDGSRRWLEPGEAFDLVEGLTKGRWFTLVPAKPEAPKPEAPKPDGKGKPKATDIA